MNLPVASAVTHVLPMPTDGTMAPHIDLGELQAELEGVATEALNARRAGLSLLEAVWDYHFDPKTNVIDVHISNLRQKVDKDAHNTLIHTVRGVGYRLGLETD